jgi:DnaK suppressor protein
MADVRRALALERLQVQERIRVLEREFAGIAEAASADGTDDEHDPEGATLAFERQHTAALLDQARAQLAAVDDALRRVDDGSYGTCERCGRPIGAERLAARPTASTCIACARRLPGYPATRTRLLGSATRRGGPRRCGNGRPRWPGRARRRPRSPGQPAPAG